MLFFNETEYTDKLYQEAGSPTKLIIPDGYTSIDSEAFNDCTTLESVVIPEGLESIGCSAFRGCTSLRSINIPESIKKIGTNAFLGCNLESVSIETSIYSLKNGILIDKQKKTLVSFAQPVRTLVVPEGVEIIDACFGPNDVLEEVILPNTIKEIKGNLEMFYGGTFHGCSSLRNIIIPEGVTQINESTFTKCKSLEHVIIPSSVKVIEEAAFLGCESLKNVSLPEGLEEIEPLAFKSCSSLTEIVFPESLAKVGFYNRSDWAGEAFTNCSSLTEVTILNPNIKIEKTTFSNCLEITNVNLPKGLTWGKVKKFFPDSPWSKNKPLTAKQVKNKISPEKG